MLNNNEGIDGDRAFHNTTLLNDMNKYGKKQCVTNS